jgi:hypothetical protein
VIPASLSNAAFASPLNPAIPIKQKNHCQFLSQKYDFSASRMISLYTKWHWKQSLFANEDAEKQPHEAIAVDWTRPAHNRKCSLRV